MRASILCTAAALLLCVSAVSAADAPKYEDLVAHAEQGDTTVDYTALRMAYAQSDDYDGYDMATMQMYRDLLQSVHDKDCPAVLEKSEKILKINFLSIFSHVFRAECFDSMGDKDKAVHEITIANGLRDSLLASGDGKTTATAFVVVTMGEEHYLLVGLGFPEEQQALVGNNGHMYDQISGHDEKTGEMRTAYFEVSALLMGTQRRLDKGSGH